MFNEAIEDIIDYENILERQTTFYIVWIDNLSCQNAVRDGGLLVDDDCVEDELGTGHYLWVVSQLGESFQRHFWPFFYATFWMDGDRACRHEFVEMRLIVG